MKDKINVKTIVILVVVLVVIVLGVVGINSIQTFMSGATSDFEPIGITAVSSATGDSATVSWTSDKESLAKVEYGTTAASLVLMAADNTAALDHRISLNSLRPGTTYYYRIRVGDEIFDNSGIPYTFKTKGDNKAKVSPTPSPTISVVPLVSSEGQECKSGFDYDQNGIINAVDLITCKKNGGAIATTPTPITSTGNCDSNIDYNSDGVVNSLDKLNCLQSLN
jgi:purple acid phosphatase-like protein